MYGEGFPSNDVPFCMISLMYDSSVDLGGVVPSWT